MVTLQLFMVCFISLVTTAIAFVMAPLGASLVVSHETRECLPNLFGRRHVRGDHTRRTTSVIQPSRPMLLLWKGTFAGFVEEYAIFYAPILLMCLLILTSVHFEILPDYANAALPWLFPLLLLAGAGLLYLTRLVRHAGRVDTLISFFSLNFVTMLWFVLTLLALGRFTEYEFGAPVTQSWATGAMSSIVLTAIAIHMALSYFRFAIRILLAIALFFGGVLYYYPGYAEIGASALRAAQLVPRHSGFDSLAVSG